MKKLLFLIPLALQAISIFAQDRIFTYTYQSNVLNKGQREIEVWNTARMGREHYFRAYDARVEFEFGLGKRVQTAFYLNFGTESAFNPDLNEIEDHPLEFGFSNEWKWKLSDPVANPIGVALYGELEFFPHEFAFETKLILDKRIGSTMHAVNFVFEPEWEAETEGDEIENEFESILEIDYAFAWNVKPGWNIGFEARNHNEIVPAEAGQGGWEHSALFIGPGFSYSTDNLWINFSIMPQVANLHRKAGQPTLQLDEHERLETRLIFSYAF